MYYMLLVNIVWFIISLFDISYLWSTAYWLFNYCLLAVLTNIKNTDLFIKLILKVIFISFIIALCLYFSGLGRYNFTPRYNGYFNDPNQMAFWILSLGCMYLYLSGNRILNFAVFLMTIFLVLITLSRSALLGLPLIALAVILKQRGSIQNKILLVTISLLIVTIGLAVMYSYGYFDDIILRFSRGLTDRESQEEGRGFSVPFNNLELTVLGAGQGRPWLYSSHGTEIHSTWLGIFFYYGIVGLILFLNFLYNIQKGLSIADKLLLMSPMIYGITTYNARTVIFWFLIAVFIIGKEKHSRHAQLKCSATN